MKYTGSVQVTVDDQDYTLRLTMLGAAELEAEGVNLFDIDSLSSIRTQLYVFFVMAKGQCGIESLKDADEVYTEHYAELSKATGEALSLFFQRLIKEEKPEKAKGPKS